MQRELELLSILGFRNRWITNESGISVYVPKDLQSEDWCVNIPNGLNWDGKKQDFTYYNISFSIVIRILTERASKDKLRRMKEFIKHERENKKRLPNCVAAYKEKKNLTYNELGNIIGVTKQRAERICKTNIRESTIRLFAEHEGLSVTEFRRTYSAC